MLSMKLDKDLKDRIDKYFEIVSAIDLYNILTQKYKFKSINESIVTNGLYINEERTEQFFERKKYKIIINKIWLCEKFFVSL